MIHDSIRGDPVGGPPSSRPWGPLRTGTRLGGRVAEPVHRTRLDRTPADRPQLEAGRHGIDGAIGARVDVNRAKLDEADWVEEEEEEEEGIEATIYALMELTRWWSVDACYEPRRLKPVFPDHRIKHWIIKILIDYGGVNVHQPISMDSVECWCQFWFQSFNPFTCTAIWMNIFE